MSPSPGADDAPRRRRLDQILSDDYLDDLEQRPVSDIRAMRDACEEEESGISYARRVVQGRVDIVRAEAERREEAGDAAAASLVAGLPAILAGEHHQPTELSKLHATRFLVPPGAEHGRRATDQVSDDTALAELGERPTAELEALTVELAERERELSRTRRVLFERIDALKDELTRRYKSGEADLDQFLTPGG